MRAARMIRFVALAAFAVAFSGGVEPADAEKPGPKLAAPWKQCTGKTPAGEFCTCPAQAKTMADPADKTKQVMSCAPSLKKGQANVCNMDGDRRCMCAIFTRPKPKPTDQDKDPAWSYIQGSPGPVPYDPKTGKDNEYKCLCAHD